MISIHRSTKLAACLFGAALATQVVGCGNASTSPASLGEAASGLVAVSASHETTAKTGVVRWNVEAKKMGMKYVGLDAKGAVVTKMWTRTVDHQDGAGPVVEMMNDGKVMQIGADGKVLGGSISPEMFGYLRLLACIARAEKV